MKRRTVGLAVLLSATLAGGSRAADEYQCGAGKPNKTTKRCDCPPGHVESTDGKGVSHCHVAAKAEPPKPIVWPIECPKGMAAIQGGTFKLLKKSVSVASFCISTLEATVKEYTDCVSAGNCMEPGRNSASSKCNWGSTPDRSTHPINCLNQPSALRLCRSLGNRLPTESEWEWAARGGDLARKYPWGDSDPTDSLARYKSTSTITVGSFAAGRWGLFDFAGNVAEWTSTEHEENNGTYKWDAHVVRGGHYGSSAYELETSAREKKPSYEEASWIGTRCARDGATSPVGEAKPQSVTSAKCPLGMAYIPSGILKRDKTDIAIGGVCLDDTEVSVSAFANCVKAGACKAPKPHDLAPAPAGTWAPWAWCNWKHPEDRATHPVNCVDWNQANDFCKSVSKRLPTNDEWEWAARGGEWNLNYPWGEAHPQFTNDFGSGQHVNACGGECVAAKVGPFTMYATNDGYAQTAPVGTFRSGRWGLRDMAGNVAEWTSTVTSYGMVVRGSHFAENSWAAMANSNSSAQKSDEPSSKIGFRCARSP